MTSEFDQLSEKIGLLAEMTQKLRRENYDLRLQVASLASENLQLGERMQEAKKRVSALIESMPAAMDDREMSR
jgi:hypothetical protein